MENRVTSEVRADGTTGTLYTYDATGRFKIVTYPENQVTTHTYATDDSLPARWQADSPPSLPARRSLRASRYGCDADCDVTPSKDGVLRMATECDGR